MLQQPLIIAKLDGQVHTTQKEIYIILYIKACFCVCSVTHTFMKYLLFFIYLDYVGFDVKLTIPSFLFL